MDGIWPSLWPQFSGVLLAPTLILMVALQVSAQTDCSLAGFTFIQGMDSGTPTNLKCLIYTDAWTVEAGLQNFRQGYAKDCLNDPSCMATTLLASPASETNSQWTCNKGAPLVPFINQTYPATSPCQGIYVKDTHYVCHNWNANDLAWRGLGNNDTTVCESYPGFIWTGGANANYTNCGNCSCCAPASIDTTAVSSLECSLDGFTFTWGMDSTTPTNLIDCLTYPNTLSLEAGMIDSRQQNAQQCRNRTDCVAVTLAPKVGQNNQVSCIKGEPLVPFSNQTLYVPQITFICQGIYVKDTNYVCRNWNVNDHAWILSGKDNATVCQSYPGFVWTGGANDNYINCGNCPCCAPASIANNTASSLGYAPVTSPPPHTPLPPPSYPPSTPLPPNPSSLRPRLPPASSPPSLLLSPLPSPPRPPPQAPSSSPPALSSATSPSPPAANAGVIVGAVIGVVVGVTALALLTWWLMKRKLSRQSSSPPADPSGHAEVAVMLSGPARLVPGQAPKPELMTSSTAAISENPPTTASTRTGTGLCQSTGPGPGQSSSAAMPPAPPKVLLEDRLSELSIAWKSIEIGAVLGSGGFADVYRGMWQENPVAVKMLNIDRLSVNTQDELRKEALAMCHLRHPCIAQVYGLVDDGTHHALVMRYYKRGSVADVISKPAYADFDLTQRLKMAVQVASGMCYLHERRLIHGDLKTANLLIEDTGRGVVIADFGLSGVAGEAVASGAMTVSISPPEVLIDPRAPRTEAGDVYAFAIVLYEIVTGYAAYRGMRPAQLRDAVTSGRRPTIPEYVPASVEAIITACWSQDAAARPVFTEVLQRLVAATEACVPGQQQGLTGTHGFTTTATATHTLTLHDLTSSNML